MIVHRDQANEMKGWERTRTKAAEKRGQKFE